MGALQEYYLFLTKHIFCHFQKTENESSCPLFTSTLMEEMSK